MMLLFFNGIVVWNLWQVQWKCAHSASSYYIYWRMDPLLFNDNTMMIKPHDDEHQFSKKSGSLEDTPSQMPKEEKQAEASCQLTCCRLPSSSIVATLESVAMLWSEVLSI